MIFNFLGAFKSSYAKGVRAERLSRLYFCLKGYSILAQRYRSKAGEIDLIVARGKILIFVEVKVRATHAEGAASLGTKQQKRIARSAQLFLGDFQRRYPHRVFNEIRFDGLFWGKGWCPHHLKNIWQPDEDL